MAAPAIARLVEHKLAVYGKVPEAEVLLELGRRGVSVERAEEGIRLGLVRGMYIRRTEDHRPVLRRQIVLEEAL